MALSFSTPHSGLVRTPGTVRFLDCQISFRVSFKRLRSSKSLSFSSSPSPPLFTSCLAFLSFPLHGGLSLSFSLFDKSQKIVTMFGSAFPEGLTLLGATSSSKGCLQVLVQAVTVNSGQCWQLNHLLVSEMILNSLLKKTCSNYLPNIGWFKNRREKRER